MCTASAPALTTTPAYHDGDPVVRSTADLGGARTLVLVPMLKERELLGTFVIYRTEVRPFTDKQIELVATFAAQAVIVERREACDSRQSSDLRYRCIRYRRLQLPDRLRKFPSACLHLVEQPHVLDRRADVARPGSLRWRSKMLLASSAAFILASVAPASAIVINNALNATLPA